MRRNARRCRLFDIQTSTRAVLLAAASPFVASLAHAQYGGPVLPGMGGMTIASATPSYADLLLPGAQNQGPPVMGTQLHGHVGLMADYTDNINLATNGQPRESDEILEATPGFSVTHVSPSLQANLGYDFHSYTYAEDHDLNSAYHEAQFGANWEPAPNWFSLGSQAGYDQRLLNPQRSLDLNDLFSAGDLTDETSASITPKLHHDFAGVTLDAAYTYGLVDYSEPYDPATDIDDSRRSSYRIGLSPTKIVEGRNVEWNLNFDSEHISYKHSFPYVYKEAVAGIGIPVAQRFVLLAQGGLESNLAESTVDGKLNSNFWSAGFRLVEDLRNTLELRVGHRFFGKTYEAHVAHTARLLKFAINYTEQPQTETERLTSYTTAPPATLPLDGVLPPSGAAPLRPIAQPYLMKTLDATATLQGRLTDVTLGVFSFNQRYLEEADLGERDRGLRLVVLRRFGPRLSATFALARIESVYVDQGGARTDDDTVAFTLARQMSRTISLTARALYLWRTGQASGDYHAALITVGAFAAF
jgi:hypothetical protein